MSMGYKNGPKSPQDSQSKALATKSLINDIRGLEDQVKIALPAFLKANTERIIRIIMTEVRKNPKLVECTKESFFGCIIQCAQLGLEPGSGLGQAWILPFSNKGVLEAQLIVGYQGMVELAERSGMVTVSAHPVFEKDEFSYQYGTSEFITHKPYFGADSPGAIIGAYSIAKYGDGRFKFEVINKYQIEQARAASKSGDSNYSPWKTNYASMARKTAVRRLFTVLPKSPEIRRVGELETRAELGESQNLDHLMKARDVIDLEIGTSVPEEEPAMSLEEQEALTEQK